LGLDSLSDQGLDAAAVVGLMAASLQLVPPGSRLSSGELLQDCSLDRLQAVLCRRA
jgi:glutamyl-tRNA synthetase